MVLAKLDMSCKTVKLDPYIIPYKKLTQNGSDDFIDNPF